MPQLSAPSSGCLSSFLFDLPVQNCQQVLQLLIAGGADIDAQDSLGRTPLMLALVILLTFALPCMLPLALTPVKILLDQSDPKQLEHSTASARLLIRAGAQVCIASEDGQTAIHICVTQVPAPSYRSSDRVGVSH